MIDFSLVLFCQRLAVYGLDWGYYFGRLKTAFLSLRSSDAGFHLFLEKGIGLQLTVLSFFGMWKALITSLIV
jgi:hypothetical protein